MTLRFENTLPESQYRVAITNMMSQILYSEICYPKGNNCKINFPSNIITGVYGIHIYGSHDNLVYQGTFMKN